MHKKVLSVLLVAVIAVSAIAITSISFNAATYNGVELEADKLYFDTNGSGWTVTGSGTDKVSFYVYSIKTGEELIAWGGKKLRGDLVDGTDNLWVYDPAAKGMTLNAGEQYAILFVADAGQTYDLLFDTTCLGHVAKCDGTICENPVDSSYTCQLAYWTDLDNTKYGPRLQITSTGNVVGTCLESGKTPIGVFTTFITSDGATGLANARQYSPKTEQQMIDDIGSYLGLTAVQVQSAFTSKGVATTWSYDASTLPKTKPTDPPTQPPTDPSTQRPTQPPTEPVTEPVIEPVTEPVTEPATEEPYPYGDKILIDADGNKYEVEAGTTHTYSYYLNNGCSVCSLDAYTTWNVAGILIDEDQPTFPILEGSSLFVNNSNVANGEVIYNYSNVDGAWFDEDGCQVITFSFYVPEDTQPGIYKIRTEIKTLAGADEEKQIFNGVDLIDFYRKEGVLDGEEAYHDEPQEPTEAPTNPATPDEPTTHSDDTCILKFDAASAGWSGATILFYIYDLEAGQELAAWGSKKLAGKADGDIYTFDASTVGIVDGKQYFIIFNNKDTTAETYPLLMDTSCNGCTAYCTGNRIENPVDSNKTSLEARWDNNSLGPRLAITSIGNVVGDTCPANTTRYDMFRNFLTSSGKDGLQNAMNFNPGKTKQEIIDQVASALGLSDSDKRRAMQEVGIVAPTEAPTQPSTDSYGYLVDGYYLVGSINGDNSGKSNVHKDLNFSAYSADQLKLSDVRLYAGDVVTVARYNGGKAFTIYPDGFGREITIDKDGYYDFYFKPYEMGNPNYWFITPILMREDKLCIIGDVDGDGEIGVIDATYIQRYNAGFTIPISEENLISCCDIDGDGEVGVIDATYILRYDAGFTIPYAIGEVA